MDNIVVNDVDFKDSTLYIAATTTINSNDTIVLIDAFTSRSGYIAYGKLHNLKLEEQLEFEDYMQTYADTSGAILAAEQNGIIPKWYQAEEEKMYEQIFNQPYLDEEGKTLITALHKHYYGGPDKFISVTAPILWLGWNNEVSAWTSLGIYGLTAIYNKSFYRDRIITIWDWGFKRTYLSDYYGLGWANDRTTSVICL